MAATYYTESRVPRRSPPPTHKAQALPHDGFWPSQRPSTWRQGVLQNRDDARDDFLIGAAFRPQNLQPPSRVKIYYYFAHSSGPLPHRQAGCPRPRWSLPQGPPRQEAGSDARSPQVPVPVPAPALGRDWAGAAAVNYETRPQAETASACSTTGIWTTGGLARGYGGPACLGADGLEVPRRMGTSTQNVVFWLWAARCLSTARGDRQRNGQAIRRDCSPLLFRTGSW